MTGPRAKQDPTKLASEFFTRSKLSDKDATGLKSHEVLIQNKVPANAYNSLPKNEKDWFVKEVDDLELIQREVLAQEFFRFFIPDHPKTRVIKDGAKHYVASQGVPGFKPIEKMPRNELRENIMNGNFTGLGRICVMAMFMNELDFKLGNIVLKYDDKTKTGTFVKLDGDWCYGALRRPSLDSNAHTITEQRISGLPYSNGYQAHNWLDDRVNGKSQVAKMLDPAMIDSPNFRKEVNETLLKILLMPSHQFVKFMQNYHPDMVVIADLEPIMVERQKQMYQAAMANPSFQAYLHTAQAKNLCAQFSNEIINFNTTGKNKFATDPSIPQEMNNKFNHMRSQVPAPKLISTLPSIAMPPKPTYAPPPPPPPVASEKHKLTAAEFQAAVTKFTDMFPKNEITKHITNDTVKLRKDIQAEPDPEKKWQIATDFVKNFPNDNFAKVLKETLDGNTKHYSPSIK